MASGDRFYQLQFKDRPVLKGDIGSILRIEGLVVGGADASAVLLLPSAGCVSKDGIKLGVAIQLTSEEWSDWLQRSDVPEILVSEDGLAKAFHRKSRYEISGHVQQKIWVADKFKCVFCDQPMGKVQLTIDHFMPLELGGENNQQNYLSACRKCNKQKGNKHPKDFCGTKRFLELQEHLKDRVV